MVRPQASGRAHRAHARVICDEQSGQPPLSVRRGSADRSPGVGAPAAGYCCCRCWKAGFTSLLHDEIPTTSLPLRMDRDTAELVFSENCLQVAFGSFSPTPPAVQNALHGDRIADPSFQSPAAASLGDIVDATDRAVTVPPMHVPTSGPAYGVPLFIIYLFSNEGLDMKPWRKRVGWERVKAAKWNKRSRHTSARRSRLHPIHLAALVQAS